MLNLYQKNQALFKLKYNSHNSYHTLKFGTNFSDHPLDSESKKTSVDWLVCSEGASDKKQT